MDSRIWRWLLVIVIVVTLASGLNFGRIPVEAWTRDAYEAVNAVQPGEVVAVVIESRLAQFGIVEDAFIAVVKHLMSLDAKIIFLGSVYVDTSPQVETIIRGSGLDTQKEYGVDYANFGYIAGGASTVKALVEDVGDVLTADVYGNLAADLPVLEGLEVGSDFALLVEGWSGTRDYISIWGPKSKWAVPYVAITSGPQVTQWKIGQMTGFINAFYGAAQYEDLSGFMGAAIGLDTAFSLYQVLMVVAIVWGNIEWFLKGKKPEVVPEEAK